MRPDPQPYIESPIDRARRLIHASKRSIARLEEQLRVERAYLAGQEAELAKLEKEQTDAPK